MTETSGLDKFVPQKLRTAEVEIDDELTDVVTRIGKVLPEKLIWEYFSSKPNETSGVIRFPYCRVDTEIIAGNDWIYNVEMYSSNQASFEKYYEQVSLSAMMVLVWVEVGFQGLQNLAVSPASVNWTSGVGYHVTDEVRAERIMSRGKIMYDDFIEEFSKLRREHQNN